jgi:hypothetical protein
MKRGFLLLMIGPLIALAIGAQSWRTNDGKEARGELAGVYGQVAHIATRSTSRFLPLAELDNEALDRVAIFLAAQPTQSPLWRESVSPVAKITNRRLQILADGKLVAFAHKR